MGFSLRAVESKVRKLRAAGHYLAHRRATSGNGEAAVMRRCLHCQGKFPSQHIGNRICPACLDDGPFASGLA